MTTVLVVDDEPIVREVVVSYLRREGYRTLEAEDGDRARELLESESPSLVVLDVMLRVSFATVPQGLPQASDPKRGEAGARGVLRLRLDVGALSRVSGRVLAPASPKTFGSPA